MFNNVKFFIIIYFFQFPNSFIRIRHHFIHTWERNGFSQLRDFIWWIWRERIFVVGIFIVVNSRLLMLNGIFNIAIFTPFLCHHIFMAYIHYIIHVHSYLVFYFVIPPRLPKRNHWSYFLQDFSIDYTFVWDVGCQFGFQPIVIPQWFHCLACNELA